MEEPRMHEALARKKARTRTTPMVYNPEVGMRLSRLQSDAERLEAVARTNPNSEKAAEDAEVGRAAYDEALAAAVAAGDVVMFRLRGLSSVEYDSLVSEFPAPDTQRRDKRLPQAVRDLPFDYKRLPPEMVARCLVEPAFSHDEVLSMWASPEWAEGELGQLYETAMQATQSITRLSPGNG